MDDLLVESCRIDSLREKTRLRWGESGDEELPADPARVILGRRSGIRNGEPIQEARLYSALPSLAVFVARNLATST